MKKRKIPQRTCIGCKEKTDKKSLLRIVRTPEGNIDIDPTGKKAGRGAYVCNKKGCLEMAIKSKAIERALECTVSPEVTDALRAYEFNE